MHIISGRRGHRSRSRATALWAIGVVLGLLVTATGCTASTTGTNPNATGPQRYVALGDSYTAGPLLGEQWGEPVDCGRSRLNYPSLVAAALDVATFVDASCGSAKSEDMTKVQKAPLGGKAAPQFDALTPDTDLVTVGIGGNDVGFDGIVKGCINLLPFPLGDAPWGRPCITKRIVDGVDRVSVKIAEARPKVDAVLAGIRERAPEARVFLVGYSVALPAEGDGCWPTVPILAEDIRYLRDKYLEMNRMLAAAAADAGVGFVDLYAASVGHDVCQPWGVAWVNTVNLDPAGLPLHPNVLGHRAFAETVTAAIRDGRS